MSIDYSKYEGHTEGPLEYDAETQLVFLTDDHGSLVHMMFEVRGFGYLRRRFGPDEAVRIQDANGRLLADAPMLLKWCRELEEMREGILALLSFSEHDHRFIESVYALLKKTGPNE